jgi:NAD(P)H-hydrate epimerase
LLAELPPATPRCLRPGDAAAAPWPALDPAAAKYGRGRLLLVAGSRRYRGAAALCLAGASASGCGSLRAALPQELAGDLWLRQPHVVVEASLPSGRGGGLDLEGLEQLDLARLDAVLLGPGLGPAADPGQPEAQASGGPSGDGLAWQRLQRFTGLLLLDADGLNRLAWRSRGEPLGAAAWLSARRGPTWITPHRGEFDRLFPQWSELEPLDAAANAAKASGAAVLLKGARSVVAAPDGRLWQVSQAAAESARAGLGDTLAGYAAGRGAMALAALGGPRPIQQDGSALAGEESAVILPAERPGPMSLDPGAAPDAEPFSSAHPLDAALLAAVALEHAQAGCDCLRRQGPGGVTPEAVAEALAARPKGAES